MLKFQKHLSYMSIPLRQKLIILINVSLHMAGSVELNCLMSVSHLSDRTFHLITGFSGVFSRPNFQGFTTDFIDQLLIFLISPIILLLSNHVSSTILWLLKLTGNQYTQAELIRIFNMRITNEQISI